MTNQTYPADANFIPTMVGLGDDGIVYPVSIDPATGRVMAEIYYVSADSNSVLQTRASHDANGRPTLLGLADDSSGNLLVPNIDATTGYPIVDLITE